MRNSPAFPQNEAEQTGHETGYELTEACSESPQFSSEKIANTIKFFLSALKTKKGIEKNILTKKYFEKITYSPENIKISFVLNKNPADFCNLKSLAPQAQNKEKKQFQNLPVGRKKTEKPFSLKNFEFVSLNSAPGVGFEPTTN